MRIPVLILTLGSVIMLGWNSFNRGEGPIPQSRRQAQQEFKNGNFKAAYEGFRKTTLDPQSPAREVAEDIPVAIQCLQQLDRIEDTDEYLEQVLAIKGRPDNWRVLKSVADAYQSSQHYGFIIAEKFYRGYTRQGGRQVSAEDRDHVRALQLYDQARRELPQETDANTKGGFYLDFANLWGSEGNTGEDWKLQVLTDLTKLPDYEDQEGGRSWGGQTQGAPVDEQGNPILYSVPASFETAKSDGERWRWALAEAVKSDPDRANSVQWVLADFLNREFGTQTLNDYRWYFQRAEGDGTSDEDKTSAILQLQTLSDDETIARLATGIKRFKLSDEFNPIKIYQSLAKAGDQNANDRLAGIMTERRQYVRRGGILAEAIRRFGPVKTSIARSH
ncbi:MAG: hypothetical protein U0903_16965 [Planctomycetales bacterium]